MQAKIWNHAQWVKETDPKALRGMFDELLRKAGFNVLSCTEHHFSPQGYTAYGCFPRATLPFIRFLSSGEHTSNCQAATLTFI